MSADRFAVTLAVDRNLFAPAVFTAHSVLSHAPRHPFDLVIAVPPNTIARAWIDYVEKNVGARVVEFPFDRHLSYGRAINRYPPSAFYRYAFNQFLGDVYQKVIFLDADIRVAGDISTLFGLDLGGQPFAAVPDGVIHSDAAGQWQSYLAGLGLDAGISYANTGVLVIDPANWAKQDLSARVLDYVGKHAEACFLADQSALNAIVRGEFIRLSPVWNMLSGLWFRSKLAEFVSPVVFHYSGAFKPWRPLTWPYDPAVSDLYREFFRDTPWSNVVNWSGSAAEWRSFLRARYRAGLRRLRGKASLLSDETMLRFRQYLQTTPFADIQQGLVVRQPDGSLHAA
ncbi:MAG TPA: glycosyltransferase [Pseudolabrys sp.]|nr:glycosyltransferase [Pseudolabrys sp.]